MLNKKVKNNIKSEKAITLIALVITIIVLLILAGISISMLSGDNGILRRTSESKTTYEEVAFKEKLQLEVLGNYNEKNELNPITLKENIEKNINNASVTSEIFPLTVENTKTNIFYIIEKDGEVFAEQSDERYVARIKSKYYEKIQTAINEASTDNGEKEIIIVNDFTESSKITIDKNVKLNLNGKKVTILNLINVNTDCKLELNGTRYFTRRSQ